MKRIILTLAFIIIALNNASIFAQVSAANTSGDLQNLTEKFENYYEVLLTTTLSDYYKKGTYIVDVKVALERTLVPDDFEIVEGQKPVRIENLPGLPFVPPSLQISSGNITPDSLKATKYNETVRLVNLSVTVLVDTAYTEEDIDFIQEASELTVNAKRLRGDRVEIVEKVFPTKDKFAVKEKKEPSEAENSDILRPSEEGKQRNEFLGVDWSEPKTLIYVIVGLGILLLLLLIYVAFFRGRKEGQIITTPVETPEDVKKKIEDARSKNEAEISKKREFEEHRTYITNACISDPKLVGDVVRQWYVNDEEQGIIRAVRAFASVDPKLLEILKRHIPVELHTNIVRGLEVTDPIPWDEQLEEVRSFTKSIRQNKHTTTEKMEDSNHFDFVDQLSDQQLLHLIKGESDEMTSILLAQIAGPKASEILKRMKKERRVSILLKMGKIDNIPVTVYKKVANYFSNKALGVSDMRSVAADGLDSVLKTIDSMPLDEQSTYIQSIAEQDLDFARRIRKFFINFEDIPTVSDEVLLTALEDLNTENLILAMNGAADEIQEKLLSVRPKRERQLIMSELSSAAVVDKTDVEQARKKLLNNVRSELKKRG